MCKLVEWYTQLTLSGLGFNYYDYGTAENALTIMFAQNLECVYMHMQIHICMRMSVCVCI